MSIIFKAGSEEMQSPTTSKSKLVSIPPKNPFYLLKDDRKGF